MDVEHRMERAYRSTVLRCSILAAIGLFLVLCRSPNFTPWLETADPPQLRAWRIATLIFAAVFFILPQLAARRTLSGVDTPGGPESTAPDALIARMSGATYLRFFSAVVPGVGFAFFRDAPGIIAFVVTCLLGAVLFLRFGTWLRWADELGLDLRTEHNRAVRADV